MKTRSCLARVAGRRIPSWTLPFSGTSPPVLPQPSAACCSEHPERPPLPRQVRRAQRRPPRQLCGRGQVCRPGGSTGHGGPSADPSSRCSARPRLRASPAAPALPLEVALPVGLLLAESGRLEIKGHVCLLPKVHCICIDTNTIYSGRI